MRLVKNATRGTGLDLDTDDLDNWSPGVSYSFANDDGTMDSGTLSTSLDSFQLDLPIDIDDEKAKQQKDPKHNQW